MKEAKAGSKKGTVTKSGRKATSTKSTESESSEPKSPIQPAAEASAPKAPAVDEQPQLPALHGKAGVFGGPKDRGVKPEDKLALPTGPHGVYERVRSLNPKSFYCAMRWNYHVEHLTPEEVKRWWANKKLLVTNAKNGNGVVVRAVDYGPHENTGLDISISPGAAEALGVEVGDEVDIALADPKLPLGLQ
ncbi:MAG: hypothetical protein AABN34_01180 [Acidobacteriota bacterium]